VTVSTGTGRYLWPVRQLLLVPVDKFHKRTGLCQQTVLGHRFGNPVESNSHPCCWTATVSIILIALVWNFWAPFGNPSTWINYHRKATHDLIRRCLTMRTLGISSLGIKKDQKQGWNTILKWEMLLLFCLQICWRRGFLHWNFHDICADLNTVTTVLHLNFVQQGFLVFGQIPSSPAAK